MAMAKTNAFADGCLWFETPRWSPLDDMGLTDRLNPPWPENMEGKKKRAQ
jgi:hypothetical protein